MISLIVAPHPDDETLGCGGTILKQIAEGVEVHWLIVTSMKVNENWSLERLEAREAEIAKVAKSFGFSRTHRLDLPSTQLDTLPFSDVVKAFGDLFQAIAPNVVYVPHRGDAHSDHRIVFDAVSACSKWFRYSSIRKVYAYETLSETRFSLRQDADFLPNTFVDIAGFLDSKIEIMQIYESELGEFPFPRSAEAISALASLRGCESGFKASEAFQLLLDRQN